MFNTMETPTVNTPSKDKRKDSIKADEAIKAVFKSDDEYLIKMVNRLFKTNYDPLRAKVTYIDAQFSEGDTLRKISGDFRFSIEDDEYRDEYHYEFQTKRSGNMALRMFVYSIEGAKSKVNKIVDDKITLDIAAPLMIQLGADNQTQDILTVELNVKGKYPDSFAFKVPVLKLWTYDIKTLWDDELYLLLPFYPLKYRHGITKTNIDTMRKEAERDITIIKNLIVETTDFNKSNFGMVALRALIEVSSNINQYLKSTKIKEMVYDMQNNNLRTWVDVLKEDAIAKGLQEGLEKGMEKGIEKGIEKGRKEGAILALDVVRMHIKDGFSIEDIASKLKISTLDVTKYLSTGGLI